MGKKTKTIIALALPLQILLVKWMGSCPAFVEKYYSNGLYPYISRFFRILFGWIPFSIGDLLYIVLAVLAIRYIYRHRKSIMAKPIAFFRNSTALLSIIYFLFHLLWGLNYYRLPISQKLEIDHEYSKEELMDFIGYLTERSNYFQTKITGDSLLPVQIPYSRKEIFHKTEAGYKKLQALYPIFEYKNPSLKVSLFSVPLTYMGYGGYLNPFSNEAQVNGITPRFRLPTVSGHEVGHQLGYSAEDATNFIGFLVTSINDDPYFKYTAYSQTLGYCLSNLAHRDKEKSKEMAALLNPGVRSNFNQVSRFWKQYENFLEPVFKAVFDTYLKANDQEEGIESYSSAVGLLIGYHKKQGF